MNKSPSISKLAEALTQAQSEMPSVLMNSQNPFLKNKYADLGAVIATSRPILAAHGLSISQFPVSAEDKIGITSILLHASGEYLEDTIFIPTTDSKGLSVAQSAGVVISYLRRYSWASILGLYADEDTDGHAPAKPEKPEAKFERIWTLQQKQAVVDAKLAENVFEAKGMLDYSVLKENSGIATVTSWATHYHNERNTGKEPQQAAQSANEAYLAAKAKAAK